MRVAAIDCGTNTIRLLVASQNDPSSPALRAPQESFCTSSGVRAPDGVPAPHQVRGRDAGRQSNSVPALDAGRRNPQAPPRSPQVAPQGSFCASEAPPRSLRPPRRGGDSKGRGGNPAALVEHARTLRFVGLGQGVDETGRFAPEAVERTLQACREYAAIIQEHHCDKVRFIATSATRDAANRDELLDGVRAILGVDPEVISGDEESRLSFAGALSGAADPLAPVLVMDSGGGSTELVLGGADGTVSSAASIDVGSRRVKERCLRNDPPTVREIAEARDMVSAALDASPVPVATANTFIGVAGTVTSLAALALGLTEYDRARVHGSAIPIATLDELTDRLLASTSAQIAALGPVTADRAAVLPAGALVVRAVAHRTRCELLIASEADILDGVALAMLST